LNPMRSGLGMGDNTRLILDRGAYFSAVYAEVEYLLTVAASPTVDVPELPIKMYGRYLPETINAAKCTLFGNEIDGGLLDAFCLQADCLNRFCPVEPLAAA